MMPSFQSVPEIHIFRNRKWFAGNRPERKLLYINSHTLRGFPLNQSPCSRYRPPMPPLVTGAQHFAKRVSFVKSGDANEISPIRVS